MNEYEPLSKAKKNLRISWYRCPIEKDILRNLTLKNDWQGFIQAGGHFILFLLTGLITYYFWSLGIWYAFIIALFFHGTVSSFFTGVAPHELGHGTVFRTRAYNKGFLYLFSLISWWDPYDYAVSHTYHHRYTMYPVADRENLLPLKPSLELGLILQLFTLNLFSKSGRIFGKGGLFSTIYLTYLGALGKTSSSEIPSQEWLQSLHEDQPSEHVKSIRWSRFLLLFHGVILLISITSGQWALSLIVSVAPFTANWAAYFVGLTQHCGLKNNDPDFRKNTRTIYLNPFLSFLYWHMNWHIEHHMFAGVPCYNLKKLHRCVADDMPNPKTLFGAWKEMREVWRKQQNDSEYQFDTPVPSSIKTNYKASVDPLESSIGDLAPISLASIYVISSPVSNSH